MIEHHKYSLLKHNTFGINVYCERFVEYTSVTELRAILRVNNGFSSQPFLHIGRGSNLLFLEDFAGVILHSGLREIELVSQTAEEVWVRVSSGVVWDDFVAYALTQGWYGLENLSWIPGEVGASAVQNIGAYGLEVCELIESVEAVSVEEGSLRVFDNKECEYAYRQSIFKTSLRGKYIITAVTYRLKKTFTPNYHYAALQEVIEKEYQNQQVTPFDLRNTIIALRRSKLPDPKCQGNAGSFFMNPVVSKEEYERLITLYPTMPFYRVSNGVKIPAGWLIEKAGWKGKNLGRAGVHPQQALVLVNRGGAEGKDIAALCEAIQKDVCSMFGISLVPEVNFICN